MDDLDWLNDLGKKSVVWDRPKRHRGWLGWVIPGIALVAVVVWVSIIIKGALT